MMAGAAAAMIPMSAAEVTPEWCSAALSVAGAAVRVTAVAPERVVHGAGTKLRVRLEYAANARDLPVRMWIKAGWEEHSPAMAAAGIYAREAIFYSTFADAVGTRAPTCFYATRDEVGRSVVILEDLEERGAEIWECTVPRSVEDAADLLTTLARLHARWWENDALLTLPSI